MSLVGDHLERRDVVFEALTHARTYTTLDEARALGIAADEALKTVVLRTAAGLVLAVVPASRRLNMRLTQRATGDRHVRLATEDELQHHFPGFELGAVPPLGSLLGVPVFVDPEVMDHDRVVFAAGSQTESVLVQTEDLFAAEDAAVVLLTSREEEEVPGEPAPAPTPAKRAARRPARKRTTTKKPPKRAVAKRKATRVANKRVAKGAGVKKVGKRSAKRTAKKPAGKKPMTKRAVKKPARKRAPKPARKKSAGQAKRTAKKAAKKTKRTRSR